MDADIKEESSKVCDDERVKLAEHLDKELDHFIASLEKRSSNEAWPEDKWQEEMEKHPFFMKKAPEAGDELPPLLQGLQDLKYSSEENTPEELAKAYKEDGNYHYKYKKYRRAILCYTEGIKQNSNDVELNGQLYNNRAAAHFYLQNFRSSYNDCKCALRAIPFYNKALNRLAQTCFKLEIYEECIKNCELLKEIDPDNQEILELMKSVSKKKKEKDCQERRNKLLRKKAAGESNKLMEAIKERGINFAIPESETTDEAERNIGCNPLAKSVHFVDNRLVWPVLILYPEYETSDIIENFHEDHTFEDELSDIYTNHADWDVEQKYTLKTIRVYYENEVRHIKCVDFTSTLESILSNKDFRIENGMPTFLVLARDSAAERRLLRLCK